MNLKQGVIAGAFSLGLLVVGQTAASASTYSVVDYLSQKGQDYSFEHREGLAAKYGIENYHGTAAQNLTLLSKLQGAPVSSVTSPTASVNGTDTNSPVSSSRTITVEATAYTASCTGCSGTTATGINLQANPTEKVIAVDPSVIPLGSKVYIEGYGEYTAADTGGAIKGNRIDMFIPSYKDAVDFGRKTLQVTILN